MRYNGFIGSNRKQHSPNDGIICNNLEQERFLDFTVQSSYTFLLNPGTTINSCRRLFIPSDPSGVLVRLTKLTDDGTLTKSHNASSICPITIVSHKHYYFNFEGLLNSVNSINRKMLSTLHHGKLILVVIKAFKSIGEFLKETSTSTGNINQIILHLLYHSARLGMEKFASLKIITFVQSLGEFTEIWKLSYPEI